jgi:UBA/TS-N domain
MLVQRMCEMGFPEHQVRSALEVSQAAAATATTIAAALLLCRYCRLCSSHSYLQSRAALSNQMTVYRCLALATTVDAYTDAYTLLLRRSKYAHTCRLVRMTLS